MGKPSYVDLKNKIEVLELDIRALVEEKEALAARAEASEAGERLAEGKLQGAEKALANQYANIEVEPASMREAVIVRNVTAHRVEIMSLTIFPEGEAAITSEQMSDDRMYRRIKRGCEIGVLEEVK